MIVFVVCVVVCDVCDEEDAWCWELRRRRWSYDTALYDVMKITPKATFKLVPDLSLSCPWRLMSLN